MRVAESTRIDIIRIYVFSKRNSLCQLTLLLPDRSLAFVFASKRDGTARKLIILEVIVIQFLLSGAICL